MSTCACPVLPSPAPRYGRAPGSEAALVAAIAAAYPRAGIALVEALVAAARRLGVSDPWDLAHLVHFESAGTFSASVTHPRSGATGLIQFLPRTAAALGTSTAALARLSPVAQVAWVERYLRPYAPFPTLASLAMAVFYPAARAWPATRAFPAHVQAANPGIHLVQDYVNLVQARAHGPGSPAPRSSAPRAHPGPAESPGEGGGLLLVLVAGLAVGTMAWGHRHPR